MKSSIAWSGAWLAGVLVAGCGGAGGTASVDTERFVAGTSAEEMQRFESDSDLEAFVTSITERGSRERSGGYGGYDSDGEVLAPMAEESAGAMADSAPSTTAAPPPSAPAQGQSEASRGAPEPGARDSITNVQEIGVDEGGIVKMHGEHLVVLRRGRLFTVRLSAGQLIPVGAIDAFAPGGQPADWYDEMLIHGDRIVVIGFSYQHSATELSLFRIDGQGQMRHERTAWLRSNDYYSSRNYASRLLGDRLVFYMPYSMLMPSYEGGEYRIVASYPGVKTGPDDPWSRILLATSIYRGVQPTYQPVLHTVVTCDLGSPRFECTAQAVVGPAGRTFYVSQRAVYIWVSGEGGYADRGLPTSVAYRLPLDGSQPGAVRVWGQPTDQFSFRESADDGFLNVLVRSEGGGDGMWGSEISAGDVALARIPLAAFTYRAPSALPQAYTILPRPQGYEMQNRFVGEHVLYGSGNSWGYQGEGSEYVVYAYPWRRGGSPATIPLSHGVDRIEQMGSAAVVIGTTRSDLVFSSIALSGSQPVLADRWVMPAATQGETRSHGFFYRPDDEDSGVLGLPVRRAGSPGYSQLTEDSAAVVFVRAQNLRLSPLGTLDAGILTSVDDGCRASCVDWYGNARPIFWRDRVFALLGYELVEGRIEPGRVVEVQRTNFAPGAVRITLPGGRNPNSNMN